MKYMEKFRYKVYIGFEIFKRVFRIYGVVFIFIKILVKVM